MDGRKLFILGAFALGACTGCVPTGAKDLEARTPPTVADAPASAPTSALNMFGEKPKKSANIELAFAQSLEQNARREQDQSEKQKKDYDEARKVYQVILEMDPDRLEAIRGLSRVYIGLRDYERASATFRKAIAKHPNNAVLYAEYSIVFSKQNQFPEAIRLVTKATELDPENLEYQRMLAVDLILNGQLEQGLASMIRARGPAAAHYYIARVYERKGRPDLARGELAKALAVDPGLQEARAMLDDMNRPQSATANATPGAAPGAAPPAIPNPSELRLTSFDGR